MEMGFIGLGAMGEPMARNLISGIAQGLGELDWSAVARVAALKSGLKT
jgi:3-hydroxyisobutyrate dehydrogenase-like beta-hydroxyacid dehydrogenase